MKMVIAVVRPERLQSVKDALAAIKVSGMTITRVTGRGSQMGLVFTTRVGEFIVDEIEKVKIEMVVDDDRVDGIVACVRENAQTGHPGDGRIFIMPVLESIRIRSETAGTIEEGGAEHRRRFCAFYPGPFPWGPSSVQQAPKAGGSVGPVRGPHLSPIEHGIGQV